MSTSSWGRFLVHRASVPLLVVATAIASLSIALSMPEFHGVDEPAHLGYIASVAGGRLPEIEDPLPKHPFTQLRRLADGYDARGGGPGDRDVVWVANHPPGYYVLALAPARLVGWVDPARGPLTGARLTSALCMAAAVAATAALARRLVPGRPAVAVGAAMLFALTVQIPKHGALAYNDSTAMLAWVGALAVAAEIARRRPGTLTGRLVAVSAAVGTTAALVRASTIVAAAAIVGAWAFAVWCHRGARLAWAGLAASSLLPALVAGPFYLRNVDLYGSATADGYLLERFGRSPGPSVGHLLTRPRFYAGLVRGVWKGVRPDAAVVQYHWVLGALVLAAVVIWLCCGRASFRPTLAGAVAWGLAIGTVGVLLVSVARFVSDGGSPHARYLLPAVPVLATLVSSGLARNRGRPIALAVAGVVMAVMAGFVYLRFLDLMTTTRIRPGLPQPDWAHGVSVGLLVVWAALLVPVVAGFVLFDQRSTGATEDVDSGPVLDRHQ